MAFFRREAVVVVSVVVSTATSVVATTRMAAVGMMFILFTLLRILAMISVAMSREHPMPLFGEGAVSLIGLGARWLVCTFVTGIRKDLRGKHLARETCAILIHHPACLYVCCMCRYGASLFAGFSSSRARRPARRP